MMKITFELATVLTALLIVPTTAALADGVIHQLPPDGSWVRFDVAGAGLKSDGAVAVALKGTMTVKSVGVEQVDGGDCRWIEIETAIEFKRGDGPPAKQTEILKLLIPAKHFATGQNPRAHVIRAWKKTGNGVAVELDLKGGNSREVESLDELFNGGLAKSEKNEKVEIKVPGGTYVCTHLNQEEASELGNVDVATETWLTDEVPFGVAAYRHTKLRKRGKVSLGGRWMELRFATSGKDAKSEIVPGAGF